MCWLLGINRNPFSDVVILGIIDVVVITFVAPHHTTSFPRTHVDEGHAPQVGPLVIFVSMALLFKKLINLSHLSIFSKVSGASLQRCGGWRLHSPFACAYTLDKKLNFTLSHTIPTDPPHLDLVTPPPYHITPHCTVTNHTTLQFLTRMDLRTFRNSLHS